MVAEEQQRPTVCQFVVRKRFAVMVNQRKLGQRTLLPKQHSRIYQLAAGVAQASWRQLPGFPGPNTVPNKATAGINQRGFIRRVSRKFADDYYDGEVPKIFAAEISDAR